MRKILLAIKIVSEITKFIIKRRVFELIHTKFDDFSKFIFIIGAQQG